MILYQMNYMSRYTYFIAIPFHMFVWSIFQHILYNYVVSLTNSYDSSTIIFGSCMLHACGLPPPLGREDGLVAGASINGSQHRPAAAPPYRVDFAYYDRLTIKPNGRRYWSPIGFSGVLNKLKLSQNKYLPT